MANNNAANVSYGKPKIGGSIFRAPFGTDLPNTAIAELNEAFNNCGYVSDDGVENENTASSEEIKAWGGDIVLSQQTEKPDKWKLKLIETKNIEVLKAIYGDDNVSGTTIKTGLTIKANSKELKKCSFVVDMVLTDGDLKRVVIPNGKIVEVGTISYKDGEATGYEVTIAAYPHSAWEGDTHREYIQSPE